MKHALYILTYISTCNHKNPASYHQNGFMETCAHGAHDVQCPIIYYLAPFRFEFLICSGLQFIRFTYVIRTYIHICKHEYIIMITMIIIIIIIIIAIITKLSLS